MEKLNTEKKNMLFDTFIYLIAKFIEGIIGIVTLSRYTYYFSEVAYGKYITINTTVQIVSAFSTMWLAQSMYRFYKKYDEEKRLESFYSTSFVIWFVINVCISFITLIGIFLYSKSGVNFVDTSVLILACMSFIAFNTQNVLTTTLASSRKTKFNLFLSVFSAVGKLAMITVLVKYFDGNIILIFISNTIIDTSVSILAFLKLRVYEFLKLEYINKDIAKDFISYGTPFLGSILTTTLINNSDRYIIDINHVAIYATNYSVISTLFTMINTGVSRGTVPTIYAVFTRGEEEEAYSLVRSLARYYLIIIVPLVFGILMISKELSGLLFAPPYVEAHLVMFFVAVALTFSFLTECSNKAFELNKQTKYIFRNSLIGGVTNLVLNIIFVPKFGYMVAGLTTVIGFLVYFILSKSISRKYFTFSFGKMFYVKVIGTSLIMSVILQILKSNFGTSLPNMIIYIIIAIVFYFSVSYYNGLLKNEINRIINLINNMLRKRGLR